MQALDLNRAVAPAFKTVEKIDLPSAEKTILPNGIELYSINAGTQDVVKVELIFNAGDWHQPKPLIANAVNTLLNNGTKTRTANQIADEMDYFGAYAEHESGKDTASFSLYSLSKQLNKTLPVLEDVIKNSVFPEKELELHLQNRRQKYLVNSKKVNQVARKKFAEIIFGSKHPYGYNFTLSDFENVKHADVVDFYRKQYHQGNCKIVVAGKVDKGVIDTISSFFGQNNWAATVSESKSLSFTPNSDANLKHIDLRDDAIQSAIRVGRVMFNKTHPDYLPLQVLNTVLGGYFGSRLMANIREDKGYTYGIGSGLVSLKNSGYFFISTEVGVEVCSKALDEIYFEIKRLRTELVSNDELELVRSYMLGVFLRSIDGPFSLADKLIGIMDYGLDYSYYQNYIHIIKTITPQQLKDLANKYLLEDQLLELVVGKKL